jgi:preprotein translocase subunit YajC
VHLSTEHASFVFAVVTELMIVNKKKKLKKMQKKKLSLAYGDSVVFEPI